MSVRAFKQGRCSIKLYGPDPGGRRVSWAVMGTLRSPGHLTRLSEGSSPSLKEARKAARRAAMHDGCGGPKPKKRRK